jgi:hypothetical protein
VLALTFAATVALARLAPRVPWLDRNLSLAIAVLFVWLPSAVVWRRGLDAETYLPLRLQPLGRAIAWAAAAGAVVFPLFAAGFWVLHGVVLHRPFAARLPADFAALALTHLALVALPEEFLFRGYLQRRLDDVFPRRWRVLGAEVGAAVPVAAALFALVHLAADARPDRIAVFFPALVFGWLRARTGTVWAPALFHGASNIVAAVLEASFYY